MRQSSVRRVPWGFLVPGVLLVAAYALWPIIVTIYMSLENLNIFFLANWLHAPFVGVGNYVAAFEPNSPVGSVFWPTLENALVFSACAIGIGLPMGFLAASAMNRNMVGRAFFRVLFIVPYAIPVFVSGLAWRLMFMQQTGAVDRVMALLHLGNGQTFWLIGSNSMVALIIANVWSSWPFFYLFILAALQSVPGELYEAGRLDGAAAWGLLRYITLPQIAKPVLISVSLSFIYHFNNFSLPFVMFGTTPPNQANTLPLNIYLFGFSNMQFGAGAAMAVISMAIVLIPMILYIRTVRVGN